VPVNATYAVCMQSFAQARLVASSFVCCFSPTPSLAAMVNDRAVARYLTHRRDLPALACQRAPTCVGCRNCGQFLKNIVTATALHFDDEAPPWQVVHDLLMQDFQLWAAVCKRGQKRHRWRQFLLGVIGPLPPPHPGKEVIERIHKARMAMTSRLNVKTAKKHVHRSPAETLDLSATH